MSNTAVYSTIWDADDENVVFSVGTNDQTNEITLNPQAKDSDQGVDLASQPLFTDVHEEKLSRPIYTTFISLLDDYVARIGESEVVTAQERADQDQFLEEVLASPPMMAAFKAINEDENMPSFVTHASQKAELRRLWFDLYDNPARHSSGFEHVFVGEGQYDNEREPGKLKGYHNWVKFHLDEKHDRVDYHGYHAFATNLRVATVRMQWTIYGMHGERVATVIKPMGGFFVGSSPACEMALATFAFHEKMLGRFQDNGVRVQLGGEPYDLVLHISEQRVRSFFPKVVGGSPPDGPATIERVVHVNSGLVQIASVLAAPGAGQQEQVELRTTSQERIPLNGWRIGDKENRKQVIGDVSVKDGAPAVIVITRETTQLANGGGFVTLENGSSLVAKVFYGQARTGVPERFL